MKEVAVDHATSEDQSRWDEHVAACEDGSLAHTAAWLASMQAAYGGDLELLVARQDDRVVGLLPLVSLRRMGLRLLLSPPPKTLVEYLGPLARHEPAASSRERERLSNAVLQAFLDHIAPRFRYDLFNMRAALPFGGARVFSWGGYSVTPQFTYIVDLTPGSEAVVASFRSDVRKAVRRAERLGLEFRVSGDLADAISVYRSISDRYHEQGFGAPYSERYLRELWTRLAPGHLRVLLLEQEGRFVIGRIVGVYGDTVSCLSGAPRTSLDGVSLNDYFHLCCMRWAAGEGITRYNMMGANTRSISEYKAKLGPQLQEYYHVQRCNVLGRLATSAYLRFRR